MSTTSPSPLQNPTFKRGMTYAGFHPTVFQTKASDDAIVELKKINANWVAINLWWYQDGPQATNIHRHPQKTVTDESLLHLVTQIRNQGMKIMLKPMVDSKDDTWRGDFNPTDWDAWFSSYQQFINHYAVLAEQLCIPLLCLGCEFPFDKSNGQQRWRQLITEVRQQYSGQLTYAANFNKHNSYKKVKFWDELDFIGIDAYFSVTRRVAASSKRMAKGWRRRLKRINRWYRRTDQTKPILFTEAGTCSFEGSACKPWQFNKKEEPNWVEQANYYEAFFQSLHHAKNLEGIFWWWWDNPSTSDYIKTGGEEYMASYTPKGKDAEHVIAKFFA